MSLPKITLPSFFVDLISTKKKHKYHPYTSKAQEILLIAMTGGNKEEIINATEELLDSSVEGIVAHDLPIFDFEHLFIKLRIVSSGDIIYLSVPHLNPEYAENCSFKQEVELNLSDVKIKKNPKHKKAIDLSDDIGVVMKYPTISNSVTSTPRELLISCIESIYDKEKVYPASESSKEELEAWVDGLQNKHITKIKEFFDTMPQVYIEIEYTCANCGKKEKRVIEGFENFFITP